jgi:hypothetical protein
MMAADSHDRSPAASAPFASRFLAVARVITRNIFITLKVFTEIRVGTQRFFSVALHKQQMLLMRGNACIVLLQTALDLEGRCFVQAFRSAK